MAAKRTSRSKLLAEIDIPASLKARLASCQDHRRVRKHLFEERKMTLPDMVVVEVRPGPDEGSWHIEVWECPDE